MFDWHRVFDIGSRSHFYRPVTELWFAGAVHACGASSACYHTLSLVVHAFNVCLVFVLALSLSHRTGFAALAATLFLIQPAYSQAVVWVSGVGGLLATMFYLSSLVFQTLVWHDRGSRPLMQVVAVVSGGLAMFAHESAATLPVISYVMLRLFAPTETRRNFMMAGFVAVLCLFGYTTILANRQNYVFTQGHYALGTHMIKHALDYLASLIVIAHTWPAYLVISAGLVGLLSYHQLTRFGSLWMLLTLAPFVAFTWGNVSRYAYLPAIGFSLAMSATLLMLAGRYASVATGSVRRIVAGAISVFVILRFGVFSVHAIHANAIWLESSRKYLNGILSAHPTLADHVLHVAAPRDPVIDPSSIEPMLQWAFVRPDLKVVVDGSDPSGRVK